MFPPLDNVQSLQILAIPVDVIMYHCDLSLHLPHG